MNLIRIFILIYFCGCFAHGTMAQPASREGYFRLSLKDALQRADVNNFQVMMANARIEQAIARISQAQSDLLPHFEGVLHGGRQTSDLRAEGLTIPIPGFTDHVGPYNTFDARPRVTVALFDPSAFERFRAAKKGEALSQAELEKTREDILALVADLFVDAERKQETVKLLQTLLDKDQMAYDLSVDNVAQGTGNLLDSNKIESDLDQTKYLYQSALQQATDARLDLEAALQIPLNKLLLFVDDENFLRTLEFKAGQDFNKATNADMALAFSQLEAHKADQKAAYADFLPKISGSADYGRSGESPEHGSNTYSVGLQVTVPLWEGGDNQARLKEVNGQIKEAQENLLDATQQEQVNFQKACSAVVVEGVFLWKAKNQERKVAQRSLRIALHAQQIGSGTVFEVMQAKSNLATAEDDYNEAQAALVISYIDLLHAKGQLRDLVKTGE